MCSDMIVVNAFIKKSVLIEMVVQLGNGCTE